jgi:phosphate:Na+ symporter
VQALGSGVFAAVCLHSAVAVAVLVSGFTVKRGVDLLADMVLPLQADIDSAITSQILPAQQEFLTILLLLFGIVSFFVRFVQ